jgi:hypothetical protein
MISLKPKVPGVVSLAFSSDFTRLELVWLNTQSGQIINAGFIPLSGIDLSSREVMHAEALGQSIETLFEELNVPKNLPLALMMPSFYTRMINLPPGLSDADIQNVLVSEAERSVVFKKEAPTLDWIFLDVEDEENAYCVYSAYPSKPLNDIVDVVKGLKFNLSSVECNITALIKGLLTTGTLQNDEHKRLIIVLNEANSTTMVLDGLRIISMVEVPISLQGIKSEDIIHDLQQDISGLGNILADCSEVVLVHNNSKVTTEELASSFSNFNEVILVEQNPFTIASLGANEPLYPCTVEALGACMFSDMETLPSFSFLPYADRIKVVVNKMRAKVLPFAVLANVALLLLAGVAFGVFSLLNLQKQMELDKVKQQALASTTEQQGSPDTYAEGLWLKRYYEFNEQVLQWMVKVQESHGTGLWLNKLTLEHTNGTPIIELQGGSRTGSDITDFLKTVQPKFIKEAMQSGTVKPEVLKVEANMATGTPTANEYEGFSPASGTGEASTVTATDAKASTYYAWDAKAGKVEVAPAAGAAPAAAAPPPPAAPPAGGATPEAAH